MEPQQPIPPAPAAGGGQADPYDFLYQQPQKNVSTKRRILIVVVGGLVILFVFAILLSLLLGRKDGNLTKLSVVAQEQHELIRVSTDITNKSRSPVTLAYVRNIELSLTTNQQQLTAYLSKHNTKLSSKDLASSNAKQTDATLASADQAGNYEAVAMQTIQTMLQSYQKELATTYNGATPTQKQLLIAFYTNTVALLKNTPVIQADTNS